MCIAGKDWNVNVGLSVNHPIWTAMYAKHVALRLAQLDANEWPHADMRKTLRKYLEHHHGTLKGFKLMTPFLSAFSQSL